MNLEKLFQMQKELDARILEEHPVQEGEDRLAKKILALLVELGELANEWRGFKYWSNNQNPRTTAVKICRKCGGTGTPIGMSPEEVDCLVCDASGEIYYNPLLEEYVDCLHFILSIGIEINIDVKKCKNFILSKKMPSVLDQFMWTNYKITKLYETYRDIGKDQIAYDYVHLFNALIGLGEMLGFTWEEVEAAYVNKNQVNHQRQESGY